MRYSIIIYCKLKCDPEMYSCMDLNAIFNYHDGQMLNNNNNDASSHNNYTM